MKKILITGANSYIGTSFENYLKQWPDKYQVDTIDMIDGSWREKSFTGYDAVFHVAGIAHQKETKKNAHLYYKVNRDLAIETAKKAKTDGVKQFILMSSMSVYGMNTGIITENTVPNPKGYYGCSKLQAENEIIKLCENNFKITIIRSPMVFGQNCIGNYRTLVDIVKKISVFPYVKNKRSVINVNNLCNIVKKIIDEELDGILLPQDKQYMNTSMKALEIAKAFNKKIHLSRLLGLAVCIAMPFFPILKKAFGSLYFDESTFLIVLIDENTVVLKYKKMEI
ncbi:MAG: NAD-dependent epimerase/dehydratase family protein [Eubacteriales bacterium]|jgi:UDP-glucose 4-epimerase